MNTVFAVVAEETDFYDECSESTDTYFYLFETKEHAEAYRQDLIEAYIKEFMDRIGCETENELHNEWLEMHESEIFNRIVMEAEDIFRVALYIEEKPILRF